MSYTTTTLKQFMIADLASVATALSLTTSSDSIVEAVNEVEAVLGAATADLTDDLKTRTVARWQAWRVAKGAAAGQYDVKSDGDELKRSQLFAHIDAMLKDAVRAASRYPDVATVIGGGLVAFTPYAGGLSRADRASREQDTDREAPFFTRALHEYAGASAADDLARSGG